MAGALGFEPRNGGTKNRCLTTWLRPKNYFKTLNSYIVLDEIHQCFLYFFLINFVPFSASFFVKK